MPAQATHVRATGERKPVAGGALASGEVVLLANGSVNKVGVVMGLSAVASGAKHTVATDGIFKIDSASATVFIIGAVVYWDTTANKATATASGNTFIGIADVAKVSGDLSVDVDLNKGLVTIPGATLTDVVVVAPAGTTGTDGWDSDSDRDKAVALMNNNRTRILELETMLGVGA